MADTNTSLPRMGPPVIPWRRYGILVALLFVLAVIAVLLQRINPFGQERGDGARISREQFIPANADGESAQSTIALLELGAPLPLYSAATVLQSFVVDGEGEKRTRYIVFRVDDATLTLVEARSLYQDFFEAQGWRVLVSSGSGALFATHSGEGARRATVSFQEPAESSTSLPGVVVTVTVG